jgi:hypothetical protein
MELEKANRLKPGKGKKYTALVFVRKCKKILYTIGIG